MAKAEQDGAGQGAFGILLIDKPAGPTSHDVVGWVRWALRERSVGHCGTLDPAATGLLVVCVGETTKLVEFLTSVDKRYVARFVLGRSTTTADAEGETLEQVALPDDALWRAEQALAGLVGPLSLPPPAYSAVKIDGRRAHALARAGEAPELPARPMAVDRLEILEHGPGEADLGPEQSEGVGARAGAAEHDPSPTRRREAWMDADLTVAKGTYVRSLAEELGRRIAVPAHLGALRRLACGDLSLDDPLAVRGLLANPLPAIEGRPPRWRIQGAIAGEPDENPESARESAAKLLRERLAPPWSRLPFPASELAGPEPSRLLDRLLQGQRLRLDPHTCGCLNIEQHGQSELHALVDRAGGRMILVRREPDKQRIAPVRVLRFRSTPSTPS
jgi:tRNA pseudouridine55 synthase